MAAIIHPDLFGAPDAWEASEPEAPGSERPNLVLIEGGAVAALRRRQSAAVYRRRRMAAASLAVLVAALALLGVRALLPAGAESASAPAAAVAAAEPTIVVAGPGDSLWSIARRVQSDGDVRPLVAAMEAANGGAGVHAGQRILVPGP